jgi:hypothetical protein
LEGRDDGLNQSVLWLPPQLSRQQGEHSKDAQDLWPNARPNFSNVRTQHRKSKQMKNQAKISNKGTGQTSRNQLE